MNKTLKIIVIVLALVIVGTGISIPVIASASGENMVQTAPGEAQTLPEAVPEPVPVITNSAAQEQTKGTKALTAALVVGIAASCGAIGMAVAICKSVEGVARQPEASSKIQTMLMLGLVFIETAIIYALIVAILIIFVL